MNATLKTWRPVRWCRGLPAFLAVVTSTAAAAVNLISLPDPALAPSASGGADSGCPIVSADGRYVLFASPAGNLALVSNAIPASNPLPRSLNVFRRDRDDGTTILVSVNATGGNGGTGDSLPVAISTNGQFVLIESAASDLVSNDTNAVSDIFVRDLVNGTNRLVSVATNGISGNGTSRNAVMTPDGRYVAFVSTANDLVVGDTNKIPDVFLRDLQAGTTVLVSVDAISTNASATAPGGYSESPVITPDGRYVAFFSTATNLVSGVPTVGDVYVRDVVAGTTTWASVNARSTFFATTGSSNAVASNHRISDNGQFVAFVAGTNRPTAFSARGIALRHNLQNGSTDIVHTNAHVPLLAAENIRDLDLTPDGRFIAFVANVTGISGTNSAIRLWDAQSGSSTLVSADTNGAPVANAICSAPAVSADGRCVAFVSSAAGLTTNALAGECHCYWRDVTAGVTRLVDADLNGAGAGVGHTTAPSLSADGNVVAFESGSDALVLNDRNRSTDVFLRDVAMNATELISSRHPTLPAATPTGASGAFLYSANADGRFVAFASEADDLVTNDTNGLRDVFVRDRLTGVNFLVSVGTNGLAGAGMSTEPSLSADGRYVAFASFATNLTATDPNATEDIFIRDLQAGTTTLVSVSTDGVSPGNTNSHEPMISADGCRVLFRSKAANLAPGSFSGTVDNLYLRDLQLGTNYALTTGGLTAAAMTPDGRFVAFVDPAGSAAGKIYVWDTQVAARSTNDCPSLITNVAISADGGRLAAFSRSGVSGLWVIDRLANTSVQVTAGYASPRPGLQFSGDGRFLAYALATTNQVFLYDAQGNTNTLVSRRYDLASGGSDVSDSPALSRDGRFVIYRSAATNLVASDTNNVPDLFVYDRLTGANSCLTQSRSGGGTADHRSRAPVFSGNGRAVLFQSWASDFATGDFNQRADLFAFDLPYADLFAGDLPAGARVLSWPAEAGQAYQVQFKDDLADAWQNLAGTVIITGHRAFLTNAPPLPARRFYRVLAE